jgi:hypothetical protein
LYDNQRPRSACHEICHQPATDRDYVFIHCLELSPALDQFFGRRNNGGGRSSEGGKKPCPAEG